MHQRSYETNDSTLVHLCSTINTVWHHLMREPVQNYYGYVVCALNRLKLWDQLPIKIYGNITGNDVYLGNFLNLVGEVGEYATHLQVSLPYEKKRRRPFDMHVYNMFRNYNHLVCLHIKIFTCSQYNRLMATNRSIWEKNPNLRDFELEVLNTCDKIHQIPLKITKLDLRNYYTFQSLFSLMEQLDKKTIREINLSSWHFQNYKPEEAIVIEGKIGKILSEYPDISIIDN